MPDGAGPRKVTRLELLRIREAEWSPRLRAVSLAAEADIREQHRVQAARVLGKEYKLRSASAGFNGVDFLMRWPACLVAVMTGVAVTDYEHGSYYPGLWRSTGYPGDGNDQRRWGAAFGCALVKLGLPVFPEAGLKYVGPILMHAGIPAYCLGDFFRLLLARRRQDPGLDAESFLAWGTAPGRPLRLSELDMPAQRFLRDGGDYAYDVVDRTLDLLGRLADPDPDFDAVRLPSYMIEKAKSELAVGHLDVSGQARSAGRGSRPSVRRQDQPRIALDPYGQGVHVVLPAIGDAPDGYARWHITADGETATVRSRAMWLGVAETTPETMFALERPVRSVAVSLSGREDLAAELAVIDPADPVLLFGDDGKKLSGTVSLPRSQVWIMHPADRDLEFTGDAGPIADPSVPFGWDGWRLRRLSLDGVQAVALQSGRVHPVEAQSRPRLLLDAPVPEASTPFGSPVYAEPPRLQLPRTPGAEIAWHVEIRRDGAATPLVSRTVEPGEEYGIWDGVPRPALGAFEVTVRGPLGRGLRRRVFVAEGLSVSCTPAARLLTGLGLATGKAALTPGIGAAVHPPVLRFGPGERAHPVEYRTSDESEPIIITPPHAAMMCPGGGVTTWTTSVPHLVTEEFGDVGRLLVRIPGQHGSQLELSVHIRGKQEQTIPASGQHQTGLVGFDLSCAADTIAAAGHAELTVTVGNTPMPVARVRPRRLATGAELQDGTLVLQDAAVVDGLIAGVYLAYAPWRPPVEVEVAADGTAVLPEELRDAGPLHVLPGIEDPWTVSQWPVWPGGSGYACAAEGIPLSPDDPEEEALSRFVAGTGELPESQTCLGRLWRLVLLAPELIRVGARPDLAAVCGQALRERKRAALLALAEEDLGPANLVQMLITAGFPAAPADMTPWTSRQTRVLERLWTGLPAVAALAADSVQDDDITDAALSQCGDALAEILKGYADPHLAVGQFGQEAQMLDRMEPGQIDVIWQAAAVVPHALLDADTRLTAARQLFDARRHPPARAASREAKNLVGAVEWAVKESRHPHLADAITARKPPSHNGGWFMLPAMSIALAVAARLAARGSASCAVLERDYRDRWAMLAAEAPDLVAIDLVLAEALVSAAFADEHHTPEDPE